MDAADVADRNEAVLMAARLSSVHHVANLYRQCRPNGYCHYCGAKLNNPEARWCDADCRDDWEKELKRYGAE